MTGPSGTFIQGGAGRILIVAHEPEVPTTHGVLVVPAFAEEMNKSRRLVWETGQALSKRGLLTIVPDLYGTGDSEGDFREARWEFWIDDLCCAVEWARHRGVKIFDVLLVRLGAALFMDVEVRLNVAFERAVAWQPIDSGMHVIKQLLRMKSLAVRMSGGHTPSLSTLEQTSFNGVAPIELGGYMLSPELLRAMRDVSFSTERTRSIRDGLVLECISAGTTTAEPQAVAGNANVWEHVRMVTERFWAAVEPGPNPLLVDTTVNFLASGR